MYCFKCGHEIKKGDRVCAKCGTDTEKNNNTVDKQYSNHKNKAAAVTLVFAILSLMATAYIVINTNYASNELFGALIISIISLIAVTWTLISIYPLISK